jgi:hypothetical protein
MSEREFLPPTGAPPELFHPLPKKCDCLKPELRRRVYGNGSDAIWMQCPQCGKGHGNALKKANFTLEEILEMPLWDKKFEEKSEADYEREREASALKRAIESEEWWARYTAYLTTDAWEARRMAVLERDKWMCQGCLDADAVQAHHLTYAHIGNEFLWELIAVCKPCHKRFHPHMNDDAY